MNETVLHNPEKSQMLEENDHNEEEDDEDEEEEEETNFNYYSNDSEGSNRDRDSIPRSEGDLDEAAEGQVKNVFRQHSSDDDSTHLDQEAHKNMFAYDFSGARSSFGGKGMSFPQQSDDTTGNDDNNQSNIFGEAKDFQNEEEGEEEDMNDRAAENRVGNEQR